ncbi:helix-turn-helix domain-containing protein [Porticoccaceae bacterium]|nr:helix-turn-helix domain-containing protein [Porticoccaceae bacterium]
MQDLLAIQVNLVYLHCMIEIKPTFTPLERAINICGGQTALAKKIGVTPQAVQQWVSSGALPPKRVLQVELATNRRVSRVELCPDLYPEFDAGVV